MDEVDADHALVDGVDGVDDNDDAEDLVATVSDFFASALKVGLNELGRVS